MNLYDHPQWTKDSQIYQNDILKFAVDAFGFQSTWQHELLFENVEIAGSRVSVKYGWGCNESLIDAYAIIALHNLLYKPDSYTVILTSGQNNSHAILYGRICHFIKLLDGNKLSYLSKNIIQKYYSFHIKGYEHFTTLKIVKDHSSVGPASIAGILNENHLFIAFDAARIKKEWLEVGYANMAHKDNRCVLSQKMDTDISTDCFFYQTHHDNRWKSLTFSAAENPQYELSSVDQLTVDVGLKSCIIDGNFHQPCFAFSYSTSYAKALASLKSHKLSFESGDQVVLSILADDYEKAVMLLSRVDSKGRVEVFAIPYFKDFGLNEMFFLITSFKDSFPKLRILLNCSGQGMLLKKLLERNEIEFEYMLWGGPCFKESHRDQYNNKRSMAFGKLQGAISKGKLTINTKKKNKRFLKEVVHIPHAFDGAWKYKTPTLEEMRTLKLQPLTLCSALAAYFIE